MFVQKLFHYKGFEIKQKTILLYKKLSQIEEMNVIENKELEILLNLIADLH